MFSISITYFTSLLYIQFLAQSFQRWSLIVSGVLLVLAAVIIGLLIARHKRLSTAIFTGFCGLIAGVFLQESLKTLTIICFSLGLVKPKESELLSTSFFGSYLTVRGVSLFIGSFPNEIRLFNDLLVNRKTVYSSLFFLYLISIVLLSMATVML